MKRTFITLLIMHLATFTMVAQDNNLFEAPDNLYGGLRPDENGVVGTIGGTVDVSAIGGATYSIPIQVPEGNRGIQPNLSIVYNSQGRNDWLGWNWSFSGMSAISHIGSTVYHNGANDGINLNQEQFALDGKRLLITDSTHFEYTEYHTEVDDMSKITCIRNDNHSPVYFKVWMSNGLIAYYGNTEDSKIMLHETENTCFWLLNRVEDRDGNYMTYHYKTGGSHFYLDYIKYTGNSEVGMEPIFKVQFNYDLREPETRESRFIMKNDINMTRLLKSIEVLRKAADSWHKIETYSFNYIDRKENSNSYYGRYLYDRLESINYSCFDNNTNPPTEYHYNPTTIVWGDYPSIYNGNSNPAFQNGYITHIDCGNYEYGDKKYIGDFNGDGLSDFITARSHNNKITVHQFLNNGNNKTQNVPGDIWFTMREITVEQKECPGVYWVYIADVNGDGLDDFVVLYYKYYSFYGHKMMKVYKSIVEHGIYRTEMIYENIIGAGRFNCAVFVGDFKGTSKTDIIIQPTFNDEGTLKAPFQYYEYVEVNGTETMMKSEAKRTEGGQIAEQWSFPIFKYCTGDFDNDGRTEIWAADENENGCFYQILGSNTTYYYHVPFYAYSASDATPFVGDFNGDGVSDMLYHRGSHWYVQLFANPGTYGYYTYNVTDYLAPALAYSSPYFGYNQNELEENMTYFLDIADMNGDGKSDVVIVNKRGQLIIFYGPILQGSRNGTDVSGHFAYEETFDATAIGLSENAYEHCVGNFFGQENQAILDVRAFSMPPLSDYYNVTSITDGMGNHIDFEYDYLIDNPHGANNDFYTLDRNASDPSKSIYAIALPIKAVKRLTAYNEADPLSVKSISEYKYSNALLHRKGKGLLGMTECRMESYTENALFHNVVHRFFSTEAMGDYCAIMLTAENSFLKKASNGHLYRTTETTFSYEKHISTKNSLIYMPLLTDQTSDYYSIDCIENGLPKFIKREISKHNTSFDADIVYWESHNKAVTTNQNIIVYQDCENQTDFSYCSFDIDIENWLIQRPGNVDIGNGLMLYEDIYYYDNEHGKPHHLLHKDRYPCQWYASDLATSNSYTYDAVGNITTETLSSVYTDLPKRKTEYVYNGYRLLKNKKEWVNEGERLFYQTSYKYDPYFDFLTSETNCRGQETTYNHDPLGINCETISSNGVLTRLQKGWLTDAPGYYEWAYSDGNAPIKTYYDLKGNVMRTETYGFDESQLIVKEYNYNGLGQLESEEEAHLYGTNAQLTNYYYDNYGRLRKTEYPDGNIVRIIHDPDDAFMTSRKIENSDGTHITSQRVNALGLVETSWDEMGITVNYTYTLDGLLETATVNNDPSTTISIEYDEARNRIRMHDPDYCGEGDDMVYTYDAYGQLRTQTTPKGDITFYDYDAFGRTITRTVGNDVTEWVYHNSDPRYKGLLKEVKINGIQEKTTYVYDPQTRRLTEAVETIDGNNFNPTRFTYYNNGKTESVIYPSGYGMKKYYTSTGHLKQLKNRHGTNLWYTEAKNGQGQIIDFHVGDEAHALKGHYKYYDKTHFLELQQIINSNGQRVHYYWYKYDKFGNLAHRTNDNHWVGESFTYDELNRLTRSMVTHQGQEYISDIVYDDNNYGCIKSKTSAYIGAPAIIHADYSTGGRPHAVNKADIAQGAFPTNRLATEYNSFDKLSHITQYDDNGNVDRDLNYKYGYEHQRIYMIESDDQAVTRTKTYVGNCEFINEQGSMRTLTYLTGPLGLFAVHEQVYENEQTTYEQIHYLFTDHLGSITTIVNNKGIIEQELSYDAWGNLRSADTWSSAFVGTPMFDRGFTGHEHLYGFGLINMNGRMYDPVLGSFLSPDNYIQSPDNSQSFNRYAYCLNNPLRYVDPDGEFFTWSINQQGFSVGLNFTPAGYPLGFGINVGWANGGSFGFYGEVAYRVGGQGVGLGFGAGFQACIDFSTNGINPSVSTFASATFGGLSAGDSAGYSWGNKSAFWGVNIGLGLGDNSGNLGGGFSLGYGSGGWSWGINGYYNKMQRASLTETGETVSVASDAPALKQNSIDDCHETVIRWQESTSFGEEMLNNETIAHCIVHSEQENGGNYFGRSSIKYASYKRHVKLTLYADDGDSGKKPLNRATYGEIYNCIQEEGRSIIGLETEVGHPIGVKSMTPTTRVNIWGKQTNGYRIVVMAPSYGQFRTMFFYNTSGIKSVATFMYKPIMN